jgi:hypothetical protein
VPPSAPKVSGSFLTSKKAGLPVWIWGGIGLGGAYLYSRYRANQQAAATAAASTTAAGQPAGTPPQFVIENNLPAAPVPSAPVTPAATTPPAVVPPGRSPSPPVVVRPVGPALPGPIQAAGGLGASRTPQQYVVHTGDNLTTIAQQYGTTAQALYAYNTTPGVRPAATIATLKARGPNLVYAGETILIPPK